MTDEKRKSIKFWCSLAAPLVVGLIVFFVTVFPVTHFQDSPIRMFAPERLTFDGRGFGGRVLGSHVLETEYGEITLYRGARVYSRSTRVMTIIEANNFARGRASHNLVVEGMVIPQQVEITLTPYIRDTRQFVRLILHWGAWQDQPEIIVSGIPFNVRRIDFSPSYQWVGGTAGGGTADIVMAFLASGYVTLADGARIYFPLQSNGLSMDRELLIDKEEERWRIFTRTGRRTLLRLPGETEFAEYREITFRPHWGEFIEGVRVE